MSEAAKTARIVEDEVARALGGKRTSQGWISLALAPGYVGEVGFGRATSGRPRGCVGLEPTVGVRDEEVDRIDRVLRGLPSRPKGVAWALNLSDLDESQPFFWEFTPEVDPELLRQLCEALRTIALPAMQAISSREALLAFHEQRPAGAPYTLPIVLALLGRREEARADVARRLEAARSGPPMWLAQYQPFAERFERWLDTGNVGGP